MRAAGRDLEHLFQRYVEKLSDRPKEFVVSCEIDRLVEPQVSLDPFLKVFAGCLHGVKSLADCGMIVGGRVLRGNRGCGRFRRIAQLEHLAQIDFAIGNSNLPTQDIDIQMVPVFGLADPGSYF